ncbi:CBS domain-containing protein [Neptunomonas qingdaonensis]|uniref:CBS domain-containing protein n=1 Tax=Neptunomonas qingdaonensis TaxID=1045558 RepID=A0A1I2VS66_9GAMM|nr:CBS domain-containing protein [Neptunomonas qingdaonensis]SFG91167.1 CBS domain-containing protein [Neptunomonas qingdaonensis]
MLKIEDVMLNNPPLLFCEQGLSVAVDMILNSGYIGLPVVDAEKHLIGFLSEQDCIKVLVSDSYHCDSHTLVKDIMRENPLWVSPHLSVLEFAQSLGKGKPKIFPVVEDNHVVGLVTRAQVMKSLSQSLQSCRVT